MVEKIMALSPDLLLVLDVQGQVLRANQAAACTLGYTPAEMPGKPYRQFIPAAFPGPDSDDLLQTRSDWPGTPLAPYALHQDGRQLPVSWHAYWSEEEQQYYCVGQDSSRCLGALQTRESQQSQERLELIDRLEHKKHHLEQFAYIVSHHLRAPVANILGLTQLFRGEESGQDLNQQVIANLRKSAQDLDAIIQGLNQILADRDVLQQPREMVDLAALLASIQNTLKEDIIRSQAEFEADFSAVPVLKTVKSFLHNLLLALIRDALRFRNPATPLQIKIHATRQENKICLTIQDNSLNLLRLNNNSLDDMPYFDANEKYPGLPWQLLRTQVEALGGKVAWHAAPGQGCTFKLFLTN